MTTKTNIWQTRKDLPPISPDSRLLKKKNTNVKGRVPEEIRNKTAKQTQKLNNKTKADCLALKDKMFNQFATRMEEGNIERERLNHHWRMKTKDSPYRYDQNEIDLRNAESLHDKNKAREDRKKRLKKVQAMTGEPFMDFYTEKLKKTLGVQERLAMDHFRLLEQLKVVKDEQATLEDLLHQDCDQIEMSFASIALQMAAKRQMSRMNSSANGPPGLNHSASAWSLISQPKISGERARELKERDNRLYQAEGRWTESGEFVPVKTEQDKVGLMSSDFALVTGNKASKNLAAKKKDYGRLVEV